MNVYLILEGVQNDEYDEIDETVRGVYSSRELANEAIIRYASHSREYCVDDYRIEERKLDFVGV